MAHNFCIALLLIIGLNGIAQGDKKNNLSEQGPKIKVAIYERVISSSTGNWRSDQNFVVNYRLINWLRLEAGVRFGERPKYLHSYYHYKIELQSKWFCETFRVIARMSDDVVELPSPNFEKTNELFIAEAKHPISKHFQIMAGAGYLFSSQLIHESDVLPTNMGIKNKYPIYKLALKYFFTKTELELAYGSYDVFNPYLYNQPFIQIFANYTLSKLFSLQSYFRYQYNRSILKPNNYFLSAGFAYRLP